MADVTAMATAITNAIRTGITGTSSGQTAVLNPFSGGETEKIFELSKNKSEAQSHLRKYQTTLNWITLNFI